MSTTTSGNFTVFHLDSCPFAKPGAPAPQEYLEAELDEGPYFYLPSDGFHTPVGDRRGYPMMYSPGFATEEAALLAAEEWDKALGSAPKNLKEAYDSYFHCDDAEDFCRGT